MAADAPAQRRRHAYLGVLCILLGAVCFSGKAIFVKLIYAHGVDALTQLGLRMLFSLPFFLLMALWSARSALPQPLARRDRLAVVGLGFLGYYLGSYLDIAGLQYITAGLERLILYLNPTIVLLISALFLGQAIRRRHLGSLALSYGGLVLVFYERLSFGDDPRALALGSALVFGSAVTYAVYLIAGARMVLKLGSLRFAAHASIWASVFSIAHFLAVKGAAGLLVPQPVYWLMLGMAVLSTVVPLWLMAEGLRRIGANQAALVGCIGPVSTIVLADLFLGEPITVLQTTGAALVLAGVLVISLKPQAVKA
jgi:drug/metabolite transporter (DMT)-like permease